MCALQQTTIGISPHIFDSAFYCIHAITLYETTFLSGTIESFADDKLKKAQPFPRKSLDFMFLQYKSVENSVGKREIDRNEQFLLLPQCFLPV